MTYEVTVKRGFGGPYFVEAEDDLEASKKGLARVRYHQAAMNFGKIQDLIVDVKPTENTNIQYN